MIYGHFDEHAREYVITNPRTPVKWINYIGTLAFGGFVDHTGGALLCQGDPSQNRITKYIQQMPAHEFRGTTLYVRIHHEKGSTVYSPFFVPGLTPLERFECHVGLGYTRIVSEYMGMRCDCTIFVPRGAAVELRDIRITNCGAATRTIDIIPVVEYTHPNALMQFTNADWVPQTMTARRIGGSGEPAVLIQYPFMHRDTRINYLTSCCAASSFECDRRHFLGRNEYGTWERPLALEQEELGNHEADRGDTIAALMLRLGDCAPAETRRVVTLLGRAESMESARACIARFRRHDEVTAEFNKLRSFWDEYLSHMQVATPDAGMNRMLNVHNQHQCSVTRQWSRYLSFYQLGMGLRGIGFRDSAQDILGVVHASADSAREMLRLLLSIQRSDGSAFHSVNPLTGDVSTGEAGEYGNKEAAYYGDDHLWIILAVCEYIKESGDSAFCEQRVPFARTRVGDGDSATVLEHMCRAIEFTASHTGAHGLPLLGYADWNDSVNLVSGAESAFVANLYGKALLEMQALARYSANAALANKCRRYYNEMRARFNRCAWDGEWFVRYFDAGGAALGSRNNSAGKIYANAQSWPVISGFAAGRRGRQALDALRARLNTAHGIKIAAPGYNGFDPSVGGVSTYPPGAKENCGIFLHTNPWVMIAETMLGRGDRAFEYYRQINPAAKNERIDEYEVEPYVYAQNILADEHRQFGLGRNSWLSGTAAWAFHAASKYILGIRPAFDGLIIDPCIPHSWDGFKAERIYRGARYRIEVQNPGHVCCGVVSLAVDGEAVEGNVVPAFSDGKEHEIVVRLGPEEHALREANPAESPARKPAMCIAVHPDAQPAFGEIHAPDPGEH